MDPVTGTIALSTLAMDVGASAGVVSAASAIPAIAAPSLGGIIGAASLASSAFGSIAQGRAQSQSAKYASTVAQQNAQLERQKATWAGEIGAEQAGASSQKTRAEIGGIKAAQAANGIDINSGSAVDVRSSAAELGELSAINIRANAARQAYGAQTQAVSDTGQAELDRSQSKYAEEAGDINAATTLLGGGFEGKQSGLWGGYLNQGSLNGGY